jgi:acetolactate synthase-1/2/3 large subunit
MGDIFGGHIAAKYLKEVEGIETVFSLPGGHIDRIYDGFLEYGVRIIDVRHEQAAAMMAHAWSIFTGQAGVCLVTAGPGFTNALTGVVNAFLENMPVVIISGIAPVKDWEKGALQDMDQMSMIRPVVKWTARCHDISRIPEYIATAFRHAVSGRPGPVYLELPPDILNVTMDEAEVVFPKKGSVKYQVVPDMSAVKEAAKMIDKAKKPLILAGSGVGCSECDDILLSFIEKTGIPFVLMDNGRGAIPDEHELSLWDGGLMGIMAATGQADVILSIGIRFNWVLMFGQGFPEAKLIRIDIEPTEINRNKAADVGLVGDVNSTLHLLIDEVKKSEHTDWVKTLKTTFAAITENDKKLMENPSDPIHPFRLMQQIRNAVSDDAIFVIDGGDTSYFALMGLRATEKSSVIGGGTLFGCLGVGVPFGISAKLARPEKTVVLVSGDGSFGLNAMEFETAVRHKVPFIAVICNDQAWGMIKHGQEMTYGGERVVGSELGVVHYEKVVEALGGHGEFVTKDEEIVPAIKRALDSKKPACVNVLTDPTVTSPATMMFVDSFKM